MLIRLLITAALLLAIAKHYLHDTKQTETVKPKAQLEQIETQIKDIKIQADEDRKKALDELGL